ncbi:hypothetical protein CEXT_294581 [Caerostris extrusa]|uniref:Uncharacterized protein n=1 Tax=Caerostris extrusa TaxID=172846 RepID=A0AAV4RSR7_CAEEX|nr:hypothetical protein CEXT_294581 [Caerostris extrusa]
MQDISVIFSRTEAAAKEVPPPPPAPMAEPSNATKRKSPSTDDDDEGFQKVMSKKTRKGIELVWLVDVDSRVVTVSDRYVMCVHYHELTMARCRKFISISRQCLSPESFTKIGVETCLSFRGCYALIGACDGVDRRNEIVLCFRLDSSDVFNNK